MPAARQHRDHQAEREPGERKTAGRHVPHDACRDALPDELQHGRVEADPEVPRTRGQPSAGCGADIAYGGTSRSQVVRLYVLNILPHQIFGQGDVSPLSCPLGFAPALSVSQFRLLVIRTSISQPDSPAS